jgi:branched-chain amino acid transport system permease protein
VTEVVQQLVNGLSLGSTYALLALGLAMVFTVFGLVNFAHGELITIAAYTMLASFYAGFPWAVQVGVGVIAAGVAAVLMERVGFRPVRGADPTAMLLTSFGISIAIQAVISLVVSPRPRTVPQPGWLGDAVDVRGITVPAYQLATLVVTFAALGVLLVGMRRSTLGLSMRAAAEDFDASRLVGVRADLVVSAAFLVSGLFAGISAVLVLARTGGTIQPQMGLLPVLNAFIAVVVGGMGSLGGAVAGGFALGMTEVALRAWLPDSVSGLTPGILFALVALVLLMRPQGLLGRVDRVRT